MNFELLKSKAGAAEVMLKAVANRNRARSSFASCLRARLLKKSMIGDGGDEA